MKQPGAFAYLLGNRFSFAAIILATAYIGYRALTGTGSAWPAIGMLLVLGYSLTSNRKIAAYGRWKREWDGMNGQPPRQSLYARHPWLRYALGIPAWAFGAWMALTTKDANVQWAVGLFWVTTILGLAALFWQLFRNLGRNLARPIPEVMLCLGVPLQSASQNKIRSVIPSYCARILNSFNR